jgi:hypothetical protein
MAEIQAFQPEMLAQAGLWRVAISVIALARVWQRSRPLDLCSAA